MRSRALRGLTRPGRPGRGYPEPYDPQWLRRRYLVDLASTVEIAAELGCAAGTVNKALRRPQLPVRSGRSYPRLRSRAWLRRAYVTDRSSVEEIAAEIGSGPSSAQKALVDAGIRRRPQRWSSSCL